MIRRWLSAHVTTCSFGTLPWSVHGVITKRSLRWFNDQCWCMLVCVNMYCLLNFENWYDRWYCVHENCHIVGSLQTRLNLDRAFLIEVMISQPQFGLYILYCAQVQYYKFVTFHLVQLQSVFEMIPKWHCCLVVVFLKTRKCITGIKRHM